MKTQIGGKLILAVIQGEDYEDVVEALNLGGLYVTLLNSTGGFLKKRSVTILIGVGDGELTAALAILKERAGHRRETVYQCCSLSHDGSLSAFSTAPVNVECGGATVFILSTEVMEKY